MIGFGTNKGIIPRVCEELFQAIKMQKKNLELQVCIHYSRILSLGKCTFSFSTSGRHQRLYFQIDVCVAGDSQSHRVRVCICIN